MDERSLSGQQLAGKRVAILATDGVEQVELTEPRRALAAAGAEVLLIAPRAGSIRAWNHDRWGDELPVDATLEDADPETFDALVLPGGVMSPDELRQNPLAVDFVRGFFIRDFPLVS